MAEGAPEKATATREWINDVADNLLYQSGSSCRNLQLQNFRIRPAA